MNESRDRFFAVTAVTLEEQMRGWLAEIAAARDPLRLVGVYRLLVEWVRYCGAWEILPFDEDAAERSVALSKGRLRIGTMDMRIASIALANNALLLTSNSKDFARIPGLRSENCLD